MEQLSDEQQTVFYTNCSTNEPLEVLQVGCVHVAWLCAIISGLVSFRLKTLPNSLSVLA